MPLWLSGVTAFLIAFALAPHMRKVAIRLKFVDLPNERKIHRDPLPLLGGAALFAGVLAAFFLGFAWKDWLQTPYVGVVIGAAMLFGIGLLDDYFKTRGKDFSVSIRFVIQILAALLVPLFGGGIQGFTSPFGGHHFVGIPTVLSVLLTVLWIVGVTNVFNFLDGVDGLAAGIAAISATTLFFIALIKGDHASAWFAIAVAGAAVGFLRHNFYPARIIMGDAGSTVLGYLLAAIASVGAFKSATVISIGVPILALGVPIFDAVRVVLVRARAGKPVYKPDQNHVHHWLLRSGLSQVQTVTVVYLISACFSLASMIVLLLNR
ncbi:UDP-GlcNAc:undecaprenyl-phosphate GlcNAc-1-phosphate transferase [Alicyclobacillus sacchari]|uniref:UDP-GlcNAc:undecaprenyl-phosphate GlcNAc-1-phosphate transferase n=1 Tax=Alicyclobacillus sacchari TaxID=392010 RepID=A0A4R8LQ41_9BACL|nr:MraY family glycosyltransferase [Alicyclobacillus sacchari]TDY49643.1 UDP-GlcNAc:undecaprenyl-phosphate GlcNAc-1-phosphate transferase [Alicyclobacillus sacchari]